MNKKKIENTKRTGKYVSCAICEKETYRADWEIKNNKTGLFFCSDKCQRNGKLIKCYQCGKYVYKTDTYLKKNKYNFCSKECYMEYKRNKEIVKCANCEKEIYRTRYYLKENKNFFCCYKCKYEWTVGKDFLGPEKQKQISEKLNRNLRKNKPWKYYKEKALQYYGHKCMVCGSEEQLTVHHIDSKNYKFGNHNIENLKVLCRNCHNKISANQNIPLIQVEKAVGEMLYRLGLDINDEHLKETPVRIAKMWEELLSGLKKENEPKFTV